MADQQTAYVHKGGDAEVNNLDVAGTLTVGGTPVTPGGGGDVAASDGSVGTPSISFDADTDTGLYRLGSNNPAIAAEGTKVQEWSPGSTVVTGTIEASGQILAFPGSENTPAISFKAYPDAGLYLDGSSIPAMTAGGAKSQEWTETGTTVAGYLKVEGAFSCNSVSVKTPITLPEALAGGVADTTVVTLVNAIRALLVEFGFSPGGT